MLKRLLWAGSITRSIRRREVQRQSSRQTAQGLHPRRPVEHGGPREGRDLRLHRRRSGDRAAAQEDARCGRQARGLRPRVDLLPHRTPRQATLARASASSPRGTASRQQSRRRTAARSARSSPSASPWMKALDEPVLIIKTAWGGKSLNTDFRPPSAGPYEFSEAQLESCKKQGKDIEQRKAEKAKETGRYYRLMIEHVKKVLADPKRVCPDYDPPSGYEIAGFVWFQGWNDMVDGGTYPDGEARPDGLCEIQRVAGPFHPRCAQGSRRAEDALRHRRDGRGRDQRISPTTFRQAMAAPASTAGIQGQCRRRGDRAVLGRAAGGHRGRSSASPRAGLPPAKRKPAGEGRGRPLPARLRDAKRILGYGSQRTAR